MKKIITLVFFLVAINSFSQIGARFFQFRPTGELGAVMKKTFSGEILLMHEFEDRWRTRFGFSYISLKPRMDTFPVVAIMYSGSTGTSVLPGYQTFHKYNITLISGGVDFAILKKDPLFLYPGIDILAGGVHLEYDEYYETYKEGSFTGGELLAGFRFRAGAEYYVMKNAGIFMEISRNMYLITEQGFLSHTEIGIGFRYSFRK